MLFIFGKRTARTAKFVDTETICYPCRSYEREISVYRSYFHFCFIPVFPVGPAQFEIRCKNCGDETRSDTLVNKYRPIARTPVWLYAGIFLTLAIAGLWMYWSKNLEQRNREYISQPMTGDIIEFQDEDRTGKGYYYVRIVGTTKDSVTALQNRLEYGRFVNRLENDDYFVGEDMIIYTRKELIKMLNNGEISDVRRLGKEADGFGRIH